jgi:hypothetical protein
MVPIRVVHREIPLPALGAHAMVAWRLGMAYCSVFVDALHHEERARLFDRALEILGATPPVVVRRVIFVAATVRNGRAPRTSG